LSGYGFFSLDFYGGVTAQNKIDLKYENGFVVK